MEIKGSDELPALPRFLAYVVECAKLLYWTYFKPTTFNQWLKTFHPTLTFDSNPFLQRQEFAENPPLQRYADQVLWINLVTPSLITIFVAILYTIFSGDSFLWFRSTLVLTGYAAGILLATVTPEKIRENTSYISSGFVIIPLMWQAGWLPKMLKLLPYDYGYYTIDYIQIFAQNIAVIYPLAIGMAGGVAAGVVYGVAVGMAIGMAIGMAAGMAAGMAGGVAGDVAGGVAGGVAFGVVYGVAVGVAFGVAVGVAVGVAFGVAFGVACILGVLRVYFWLPELLWMLVLFFTTPRADIGLRWLPPYFDELIILPLPFMESLIIRAYHENPNTALQTIDYFINHTNQQAVARRAMIGITLLELGKCKTPEDIGRLATEELTWIPTPPPDSMGRLLPKCLEISQAVRQAIEATTVYRQYDSLKQPITELHNLRKALPHEEKENKHVISQLGMITQTWLGILETAQKTLAEQAKKSGEIPAGAYIAGNGLDPDLAKELFRGRQDIFHAVENISLSAQPPTLLLYGKRRTGKTSALYYLPKRVGPQLIPLIIDLQKVGAATQLYSIAELFVNEIVTSAVKNRNLILPRLDRAEIKEDPFPALFRWFTQIEAIVPNKRFLLCLDEFECLEEVIAVTNSRAPLNFLRHILQHYRQWIVLFAGAHHINELADYWSNYLINTQTLHISYLQEDEARSLIIKPVNDFPDNIYEPLAVDRIIYYTRCQPYLVQLLCQTIVTHLNKEKRRQATKNDVEIAIPKAIGLATYYFDELWKTNLREHSELLTRILQKRPVMSQDNRALNYLIAKEVLEHNTQDYHFQVPMVEYFVKQKLAQESV